MLEISSAGTNSKAEATAADPSPDTGNAAVGRLGSQASSGSTHSITSVADDVSGVDTGGGSSGHILGLLGALGGLGTTPTPSPSPSPQASPTPPSPQSQNSALQPNGSDWDNVEQGGIGDCYFVSALVDTAKNSPQDIGKLIKDNGNGSYTVSFHGQSPVTVDGQGIPNGVHGSSGGAAPQWASILEQAWEQSQGNTKNGVTTDNGGSPSAALKALTGNNYSDKPVTGSPSDISNMIKTDLGKGQELITGASTAPDSSKDQVYSGHAYSIVGEDKDGNIEIRNPWNGDSSTATTPEPDGHTADSQDGTFWVSPEQYKQNFGDIVTENKPSPGFLQSIFNFL